MKKRRGKLNSLQAHRDWRHAFKWRSGPGAVSPSPKAEWSTIKQLVPTCGSPGATKGQLCSREGQVVTRGRLSLCGPCRGTGPGSLVGCCVECPVRPRARRARPGGFVSHRVTYGLHPEGTGQTVGGKQGRDRISSESKENHSDHGVENGWREQDWRQVTV